MVGIPDDVAMRGMLKARPDPGLMTINKTELRGQGFTFINAFGVNDKDSTTVVFNELDRRGYFEGSEIIGVFHARGDRVSRTLDFGVAMVKEMSFNRIILIGKMTNLFIIEAMKAGYMRDDIIDLGDAPGDDAVDEMVKIAMKNERDCVFFGCGNMVGPIPTRILEMVGEGGLDMDTGTGNGGG
jgi:hypothetical protein